MTGSALVGSDMPLGILPLGTLNHFARDLGLPQDLAGAIGVTAARKTRLVVAQAGTAISTRRRGEPNNYDFLRIDQNELALDLRAWDGERFVPMRTTRYVCVRGACEKVEA